MDLYHKLLAGTIVSLLAVGVVGGISYIHTREDKIRAEERQAAAEKSIAANNEANRQRDEAEKLREAQDAAYHQSQAAQLSSLAQTVANLKTPQQQAAWSQDQLKDMIKGIVVDINPKTGQAEITVPKESVGQLPAVIEKCKDDAINLSGCQHDLASRDGRIADLLKTQTTLQTNFDLMKGERDQWKNVARGGSFWHKVSTTLLDTGCAGVGAAIGAEAGGKSGSKARDAAIGAAATLLTCKLFKH